MNYSEQELSDKDAESRTRSFQESILSSSPVKTSMLDHESALMLNVNNYAAGYIEPLNSSLSNSALLKNLMKTQNLSQNSGQAMMQSTQQDHTTRSHLLASKRIDFSAPTTQFVHLDDQSLEKQFIINPKDQNEFKEVEASTDEEHPLMAEQMHDEKTFDASNHSLQSTKLLEEMKNHMGMDSSPKFLKTRITEGSQTAHDLINEPISCFRTQNIPNELIDFKEYELYAWGLNDSHQLGQLEISPKDRVVIIPRKVKDDLKIEDIQCSQSHCLLLTKLGQLLVLGNNSHGQLGLSVQEHSVVSFSRAIEIQNVVQVATCRTHSLLLTADAKMWATGLNANEQLGVQSLSGYKLIHDKFTQVTALDNLFEGEVTINKIFCMENASGVLLNDNEIWAWGSLSKEDENLETRQIYLPNNCQIGDLQFGSDSILLLTKSGTVFQTDATMNFQPLKTLSNIKEIAAYENYFACLDTSNEIYIWNKDGIQKLEKEINKQSNLHFCKLSIGEKFGHVTDQYGNLHGWGNNKNGELGTGDLYPRNKLSQIRIFNSQKQYMRCKNVFSGQHFTFGLFESNMMPSIQNSLKKDAKDSIESSFRPLRTSVKESLEEDRNEQYNETQNAIDKYRDHAKKYKMNVAEASEDYDLYKASRGTETQGRREARSISPYHNMGRSLDTTLTGYKFSPDITVALVNQAQPQKLNQLSKSKENYSFSQLHYKFDENRQELLNFKNQQPEKRVDPNVNSNETEGIYDFERRRGSFGLEHPPTVTSIEELDSNQNQRRSVKSSVNRKGQNLKQVIQSQISKTSDLLVNAAKRGQSHDIHQNTSYINQIIQENTVYEQRNKDQEDYLSRNQDQNVYESSVSVVHIPKTRNEKQFVQNIISQSNTFDMLSNSKSTIEPSIIHTQHSKPVFINRDSGHPSRNSNSFVAGSHSNRDILQKLNKYKRKIKKYINTNNDLQRQLEMQIQHNVYLTSQNDRMLKTDKYDQNLKSQIQMLESQLKSMKNGYESIINEKDSQIEDLTQENLHMLNEIQQRDEGHQTLEEKLEYVDNEICNLAKQLQHQNRVNARLKEELKKARARDKIVNELGNRLDQQQNEEQNENEAMRQALEQQGLENQEQQSEIEYLRQQNQMTNKENDIMARNLAELREKIVVLERNQSVRKIDQKTYDNMQNYQDKVNGYLQSRSQTNISQNSWTQKHGPLVMNYNYEENENGTKRTISQQRQQFDLQNGVSFQPSLQKLDEFLGQELNNNKVQQQFVSDPGDYRINLPTFEARETQQSQKQLINQQSQNQLMNKVQTQRDYGIQPTFYTSNNALTSAAVTSHGVNYEQQVFNKALIQPDEPSTYVRESSPIEPIAPYRSKSGPSRLVDESVVYNQQLQMNTLGNSVSPQQQQPSKAFSPFYQAALPAETFPNYAYVKEHYLNGSIKSQKPTQQPQTFQPSPCRGSSGSNPRQVFSNRQGSPFKSQVEKYSPFQSQYDGNFTYNQQSKFSDYKQQPSKFTENQQPGKLNYTHSPIPLTRQTISPDNSLMNLPRELHSRSPPCDEKKVQKIDQGEQKSKYINSILSKFELRTNNRVMQNMNSRDAVAKSQEPLASRRKHALVAASKENSRTSFGEIRSLDRIAQINEKKSTIDEFKEKSRDWYLRKGRQTHDKLSHNEVSQKYKDAFKNLSMELKKKIDSEYRHNESIDNNQTDQHKRVTQNVAEDQYFSMV